MSWSIGLVDFKWTSSVQSDSARCVSRYMEKYLVRTNEGTFQGPVQVASAIGILRGSPYGFDPNAICESVDIGPGPAMTKPPFLAYFASYEWGTNTAKPADDDDDPTTTRTIWTISPQIQSRYVIKDRLDVLILNSAGDPFDGGIPVDVRLGSVTATRKIDAAGYDKAAVLANSGKLNSVTFLGGAAKTVQVDISASEKYEGGYHWWDETYTFSYDPKGWQPQPIQAGFFQKISGALPHERILNEDTASTKAPKEPCNEPEPLDASGLLVPVASRPGACIFKVVDYYDLLDFSTFGL